ncbi:hypothetical protein SAMN05661010_02743 [Modicisalibacter muralis]|uniref:UPF0125 protein SAMN05661010_02743 n=1 Tax=Modicisalibacter muralis TaxID=119000 RepID=A0A1G9NK70_9GAMM|nr:RnfH family protein [Halomonas muralis]SDL86769.1 hypothetical protein SAMN05661010_02743 [Halomonas muralis]
MGRDEQVPPELTIEVAFALPERQKIVTLAVPPGTTARQAVRQARLDEHFPELPAASFEDAELGIFGKRLPAPERHVLRTGDRVEVYRPLRIDPKQARIERAARRSRD